MGVADTDTGEVEEDEGQRASTFKQRTSLRACSLSSVCVYRAGV